MTSEFFRSNTTRIVTELITTGTSTTYDSYTHTDPAIIKYHADNIPEKTPLIKEFEADLMTGAAEYVQSKSSPDSYVRRVGYDKFFNHPENMRRAREIQKTYSRPVPDPVVLGKLFKMLTNVPHATVHPIYWASTDRGDQNTTTMEEAIMQAETKLFVTLKPKRYLGSIGLQLKNWYHQWGLSRFDIIDDITDRHVGSVIIHQSTTLPPTTTPLLTNPPLQIINTTGGYNIVHELTHAVNFSFVPYYKIPRDLVEIAPMCMENAVRSQPISNKDLSRQAALAIADLTADTPDEFNVIYSKYTNTRPVGHVRARMWHFTNMPFKYYSYALGMNAKNYSALKNAVRSENREDILLLTD